MKKILLIATLFFTTYCFANSNTAQLYSAIQSGFSSHTITSQHPFSFNYGGKDISRPKMAVADERTSTIAPKSIS
jgi:hypothetical protein